MSDVPVLMELEIDVVVTQTLTSTVPATLTIQSLDFQTRTVPVSVTVAVLPDSEVVIELLPPVEPVETETPTPEETPTVEVTATQTITPEATIAVTATVEATPTVIATVPAEINGLTVIRTTVSVTANLRAGPSTDTEIVGEGGQGQEIGIVAVSEDGQWYLLSDGTWIANFLVTDQPTDLPIATQALIDQLSGMIPVPTPTPTLTPRLIRQRRLQALSLRPRSRSMQICVPVLAQNSQSSAARSQVRRSPSLGATQRVRGIVWTMPAGSPPIWWRMRHPWTTIVIVDADGNPVQERRPHRSRRQHRELAPTRCCRRQHRCRQRRPAAK